MIGDQSLGMRAQDQERDPDMAEGILSELNSEEVGQFKIASQVLRDLESKHPRFIDQLVSGDPAVFKRLISARISETAHCDKDKVLSERSLLLFGRASLLFGSPARALEWMKSRSLTLESTPLELLQTEQGEQIVEEELVRLEHGMLA
jgi:antitoxin Xre/MbcA/ParS-like protein